MRRTLEAVEADTDGSGPGRWIDRRSCSPCRPGSTLGFGPDDERIGGLEWPGWERCALLLPHACRLVHGPWRKGASPRIASATLAGIGLPERRTVDGRGVWKRESARC